MVELEDTEFVAPHKFLKNTSTNGIIPTELLLNSSGRLRTPKRTKEKRKRKEESKKRPATLAGLKLKLSRDPHIKKDSLTEGKSARTEKELQGIKGEFSRRSVEGKTK